jgi:hypothetical protein
MQGYVAFGRQRTTSDKVEPIVKKAKETDGNLEAHYDSLLGDISQPKDN